jgi:flagellar basal-body rod modification protein FlgD
MLTSNAAPVPAATTNAATNPATNASAAQAAGSAAGPALAGNFNQFLQLLTTQLQHQDPTSPLDPNQFTQELVQFASVEQQINTNTSLSTMISLQQTQQAAAALTFLGATVAVSGSTTQLANGTANWSYSTSQPATATINITNASGQVVYSTSQAVQPGPQTFTWNGVDSQGNTWPSGPYTISVSAVDANNQNVPVTTGVQGVVTGVNLSQSPPTLTVGGQSYALNQVTQVLSPGGPASTLNQISQLLSSGTPSNVLSQISQLLNPGGTPTQ